MTRSSTNKLFTPYKEPEREFRSSRRHFKLLCLDKLRSPDFNLFSDQEYSEEAKAEAMAETMDQYMSKARADYGSGVARPKIKEKDSFELKGQFLKELQENMFSGSDNKDANEHIEKVIEIVHLVYVPNITEDQLMLRVFPISLSEAASCWLRNEPTGSIKTWEDLKLRASVSVMPLLAYLNLGLGKLAHTRLTVELTDRTVKYPKGIAKNVLVGIGKFTFPINFIILDMPKDIKEESIVFSSVKPASSLINRVYMLSLRERMKLDLEARLMGENMVLNRSLDPFLKDYIELNDLNEPFELRRNQRDDLMPTIEEGEVIEEFRTKDDELDTKTDDYPSYCDLDKKIHIDCAHNLKFSCMIGFEFTHVNFFPLLYVNVMSKKFHNSLMKNKMVYKGDNVVRALMNVPIFVGTFFVMTDFAVLEDMDTYRNKGMGDVIVGEPFLREVGIKTKRFEGIFNLYKSDDEISEKDEKNGISHAYQNLKGFYKGALNLGPDYIRKAKTEEWLTRGHINVHEME
ncbi:hypothetical protein Tco_1464953 [Tanacetum coccineum]